MAVSNEADRIEAEFSRGSISEIERNRQLQNLDAGNSDLFTRRVEMQEIQRQIFVSHGNTFYEKGGVIRSDEVYLVALNSIDGNEGYYFLDDTISDFNIIWGEFLMDVQAKLDQLSQ